MSSSVLPHVSVISMVLLVALMWSQSLIFACTSLPSIIWQVKCLIIYTPRAALMPSVFISLLSKILICVFVVNYDGESRALWCLHRQKNPPCCFQLFSSLTSANGRRWCWGEGCLWETETASPFSIFHPRLSPPPSSLCWHASYRLPGHIRRAQSGLITLVALPAAVGNQENVEVRRIPTRTEVYDYADPGRHVRSANYARNRCIILISFCQEGPL